MSKFFLNVGTFVIKEKDLMLQWYKNWGELNPSTDSKIILVRMKSTETLKTPWVGSIKSYNIIIRKL